jgi:protein CpxP
MRLAKYLVPSVAVLVLSLSAAVAFAAPTKGLLSQVVAQTTGERGHRGQFWSTFLQELNLSQDQVQKIQDIRNQYKSQLAQPHQDLADANQKLRDLLVSGTATDDEIRTQHSKVEALQQQLADAGFEQMLAIRAVLTPEQRQRAADLIQQRHQAFKQRLKQQIDRQQ